MAPGNNETENRPEGMEDNYLWDGSGEPDPEIQRLEALLHRFQHSRPAPVFPEIIPARRWRIVPRRVRLLPALAVLAAAVVITVSLALLIRRPEPMALALVGWDVIRVTGTPQLGPKTMRVDEGTGKLGVGQALETDGQSRASLRSAETGVIEVEPDTRVRLLTMNSGLKRIALDRGTIHASIWAPAGEFVVDTPSAIAVDLGCKYTLQVDDSGAGLLRTKLGWVGFQLNGHEAFIPAGAACATRPKIGPGTPYFEDASAAFRTALARLDFEDNTPEKRRDDLSIVLAQSRPRDALTLWHLLVRVDEPQRGIVYDRLRRLVPPPRGVTREGILHLDRPMLDLWWNQLGFDDISVWRHWERSWLARDVAGK
jgi:FecR protein